MNGRRPHAANRRNTWSSRIDWGELKPRARREEEDTTENSGSKPSIEPETRTPWMLDAPEPTPLSRTPISSNFRKKDAVFAAVFKDIYRVTVHKRARASLRPPRLPNQLPSRLPQIYQLPPSLLSPYTLIAYCRMKSRLMLRSQR